MENAARIAALMAQRVPVHLTGICGVGMAGLAYLLQRCGVPVSGCDAGGGGLGDWLRRAGIDVLAGHDPAHLDGGAGWVIRSTAVPAGQPECRRAREAGLPVFQRGEVLPVLLRQSGRASIAVCGTHGKTSTACFTAHLLQAGGFMPAWCIGGETDALPGVAGDGGGDWIVAEADESDGTLAGYTPDITILTNVDFDHMEHFRTVGEFEACFSAVLRQTRREIIVCGDSERALRLARAAVPDGVRLICYGFTPEADLRVGEREDTEDGQTFTLQWRGHSAERLALPLPGRHNLLNATAAIAAAVRGGMGPAALRPALACLRLPKRRFECVYTAGGVRVLSDYAHHPVEIQALVQTARERFTGRLRAVFQPHRYTRTKALRENFPPAFSGVDELVLTPVYPASEQPLAGGNIWDLYAAFRGAAGAGGPEQVFLAGSTAQAWAYYRHILQTGDTLLVIGAGDIEWMALQARALQTQPQPHFGAVPRLPDGVLGPTADLARDAPIGRRTTFRLGGRADLLVTLRCEADFVQLCAWCHRSGTPLHVHAAGSNVLVSDLGVRGVVAILDRVAFGRIREDDGAVHVGPACSLARLLDWCEVHGRGGLESLEGIPGTVGGAMRMNAGAWGVTFGERVESIRCLFWDGSTARIEQTELGLGYRRCELLDRAAVLEVALDLPSAAPDGIRARRRELALKRQWQKGLRSAGSVFKNPPGLYAAQLIEAAGLKGVRIGGAEVLGHHANIMVADEQARASDVLALIGHVRDTVSRVSGVELHTEVRCLE